MDKPAFNKSAYDIQYKRDNLKRIPLDVPLSEYDLIKQAAQAAGQAVNTYIKQAIRERMNRENNP